VAQLSAHSFDGALVLSILATIGAVTLLWTEVWLVALDFALFALVCRFYCFAPLGARELFWLAPGMILRHQRINWRGGDQVHVHRPENTMLGLDDQRGRGFLMSAARPVPDRPVVVITGRGDLYPFRFAPGLAGALAMGWTSCAPRPAPEQG
jgi:hypothetical protein